jgi:hypothetical protein
MVSTPAFTLRPLGIGEIFDRAVTLYVRHFVAFTLMVLTLLAPLGVVQYIAMPSQADSLSQTIGQIQHPEKKPPPPLTQKEITTIAAIVLFALIVAPFVNSAVAVGVARVYNGAEPSYGVSFATVLRRWAPLLGTAILNVLILAGLYMALIVAVVLLTTVGLLLVRPALPLAIAIFVFMIAVFIAVVLLMLMLVMVYAFAMYSCALENASPAQAIGLAYSRIFNRREFKKALLMTLAYVGLEVGVLTISSTVGLILLFTLKSYALELTVNTIVSAMMSAFVTILLAVYYYDVRTRSEGLDLETDLARLTASS